MKIAVRALVLGMLLTGFAANHMLNTKTAPSTTTMVASNSAAPVPGCGSGACGMDKF